MEESEEDEDLEAAVAMEDVAPEEHLRLRLRHLKERRQAAQRAGPIGREDLRSWQRRGRRGHGR